MDIHLSSLVKSIAGLQLLGGQVHGILGHSGSGKSTLLNLVAMLDRPDRGSGSSLRYVPGNGRPERVWNAGAKRTTWFGPSDDTWRKEHFSFVFQAGYLLENFTVLDNVMMPMKLKQIAFSEAISRAKKILEHLEIPEKKWRALPRHLSGGQQQRVAVARAICNSPSVIFADEPTGSLDPKKGVAVMDCLLEWKNEDPGNLLILVTHNPEHVQKYCDHVTVLSGGEIVLDSRKDQVKFERIRAAMSGDASHDEPRDFALAADALTNLLKDNELSADS